MAPLSAHKSTIVRSFIANGWHAAGERVAPDRVAAAVERSWFTVPRPAPSAAAGPAPSVVGVRELLGAPVEVEASGRVVRGWVWGQGPVVYLVHGWGGTLEHLVPLVGPLLDAGLQPVAFDALGHGRSDAGRHGRGTSDAVEMGRSLDAVAARFGPARAVVAHSAGAVAAVLALRDGWLAAERLVLVSPVPGVPFLLEQLRSGLRLGPRTTDRLRARTERRTGYPVDDLDVAALGDDLAREAGRPGPQAGPGRPELLVVHDLDDPRVPHAASASLVRGWPGAQLLSTVGLGHRRVLADPAVVGAVARFVDRRPVEAPLHEGEGPAPWPFRSVGPDSATWSPRVGHEVA